MRRWMWALLFGLSFVGGGAFLLWSRAQKPLEVEPSKLTAVERGTITRSVVATGKIQPKTKVEVKSKASGIVRQILVEYGDTVRQGQVLAELDKELLQATVREATARLEAAQAAKLSAEALLERHKTEAEGTDIPFLKRAFERAQQLAKENLLARTSVEDAEKFYQMALNKQVTAQRNLLVSKAEITRAAAQVSQAQAELERANEDLRNATIVSPMQGLVLSRNIEVGDAVSSILVLGSQATLVFTLGDVSDVYVLGKVDQADIGKVYLGQPARITVESFKDKVFQGEVTKISPLGVEKDNVTTFEVRASIRNPGSILRANMSANAEIILEEKQGVLTVSESALLFDKQRNATAEVVDPTQPAGKRVVPVKLGITNGVKAEVLSGLSAGQKVVLQ